MKYPKFLDNNSIIGITAPSAGVGQYDECFDLSLETLKKNQWKILETKNVRTDGDVSSSPKQRTDEFIELMQNEDVDMIFCASGGDFLTDMLPSLKEQETKIKEKWVMGASDPTNLLYYLTTSHDIATLYGHNAGSFDSKNLYKSQEVALEYLKGNILPQESYEYYEEDKNSRTNGDYNLTGKVEWKSNQEKIEVEGRVIGGCLDCLKYLPGTPYDKTNEFIEKYKEDGILWYFDIFSMTAEDVYLTLFQLKEAGWFKYAKGIIVGRVLFPNHYTSMTYERAFYDTFKEIPVIIDADIGHVAPKMTIMNGSIGKITYQNHKGMIEQYMK